MAMCTFLFINIVQRRSVIKENVNDIMSEV